MLTGVSARDLPSHRFNTRPVGTGPFVLSEISSQRALLVPNPRFFGRKRPYLAASSFDSILPTNTLLTAYRTGQIMGISEVPPHLFPEVTRIPGLNTYSARISGATWCI